MVRDRLRSLWAQHSCTRYPSSPPNTCNTVAVLGCQPILKRKVHYTQFGGRERSSGKAACLSGGKAIMLRMCIAYHLLMGMLQGKWKAITENIPMLCQHKQWGAHADLVRVVTSDAELRSTFLITLNVLCAQQLLCFSLLSCNRQEGSQYPQFIHVGESAAAYSNLPWFCASTNTQTSGPLIRRALDFPIIRISQFYAV